MISKEELMFAKRLQEEDAMALRDRMEEMGVLDAARESAKSRFQDASEKGVDMLPEIAGAMAWRKLIPSTKPEKSPRRLQPGDKGKVTECGRFEIVVSNEGIIKVVPIASGSLQVAGARSDSSKIENLINDPSWTADTRHDPASKYQYFWWPGSWYKYATMLRKVNNERFNLFAIFAREQDRADSEPHPVAMMPPEQLVEKVLLLQRLQMRREDLAKELSRLDTGIRRELRTLPPASVAVPEGLDAKSLYAYRALQGQRQRLDAMLLGPHGARAEALKAEGGRLATKALAIATLIVGVGAYAGWRAFHERTGVDSPEAFRTWAEDGLAAGFTDEAKRRAAGFGGAVRGYVPKVPESSTGQLAREVSDELGGLAKRVQREAVE